MVLLQNLISEERSKVGGDFAYTYTYTDIKGNEYNAWGCLEDSVYYKMFLASSIYRESCYHCPLPPYIVLLILL